MKNLTILFVLICMSQSFAQNVGKSETGVSPVVGTVTLRNLPSTDSVKEKEFIKPPRVRVSTDVNKSNIPFNKPRKTVAEQNYFQPNVVKPVSQTSKGKISQFEAPCLTYEGLNAFINSGGGFTLPPDVGSAVGHDHIFEVLNDRMRIQDKEGNILFEQLQEETPANGGFWSIIDNTDLFDPKIIYDPYRNRWIYVILTDAQTANSAILIAISQTPDPTGGWWFWRIDGDADNNQWFDYPSIGFNNKWLTITGNMFSVPNAGGSNESRVFIFDLNQLYSGSTLSYTSYNVSGYSTLCPALTYDPNMNDHWLVTNDDVNDNDLRFFKISGNTASPILTEESWVSIGTAWGRSGGNLAPQLGSSNRINCGDHDVLSVIWRNGRLYSAQTVFLPDGASPSTATVQIVSSNPYNATAYEAIRVSSDANTMYAFPCLAVNNAGDLIVSTSKFTTSTYPSACVWVRRSGDPTLYETVYKSGEDWYQALDSSNPMRNRWGDYTSAMVDPSDDNTVWVTSEYSRPRASDGSSRWATWWGKICNGNCTTNLSVTATQTNGTYRKYEASHTVFTSSTIQSGANIKYDGGNRVILQPGFRANQGSKVRVFNEGCAGSQ
jgi:hypothetical protein